MRDMEIRKKIRVLIVDDSKLFREFLIAGMSEDPSLEIVGWASDPYMARDKIIELAPDVMTLDIEMPKMDGIEFLRKLMPQHPMPIVVVSSIDNRVFEALHAGAVDYVVKPAGISKQHLDMMIKELTVKVKIASTANLSNLKRKFIKPAEKRIESIYSKFTKSIIAIGASTGGTEATHSILKALPQSMPPIVIVQHMPPIFTKLYADRMNGTCSLNIKEAENGDELRNGYVYIAPGDQHMKIVRGASGSFIRLFQGERVNGHCPSADVLFDSVAELYKGDALGIILTGMGNDGSKGLLKMRQTGSRTIGQDCESCIVYGMPKVANDIGAVEREIPLKDIADLMYKWVTE